MASPAMKLSLFLLLTLFSSLHSHARDSQFFNKIPSTTNNVAVPNNKEASTNQQEPNFLPENENSYGLYGHESGQNPPSTAAATTTTTPAAEFKQPVNKYLPKNYNPVAYVTHPESDVNQGTAAFPEESSFSATHPDNDNNRNNYYSGAQNYYNNNQQQQEEDTEFRSYPAAANNGDNAAGNFYYNGGSSFNSQPQGQSEGAATFSNGRNSFQPQGQSEGAATFSSRRNSFQPQGMSDTRYLENGKYYYDLNSEKYSSNHPYETLRGARPQNEFNNRNFYGNNAYEFNGDNSMGGYQNREEFQDDENMP
ncbi:protein E6-like [Salvia miltiorrhiza]|uniref:protein E6-like n=1 Tax=Salvia miltiorrhiza TaxID=226208 RepID=UPI0025AD0364|nr:protein E6-like [Salvia miltiorrhiza]